MAQQQSGSVEDATIEVVSSWSKWKVFIVVYVAAFVICTQSKLIQSMILYVHVVNFPFWLSDTAYHGLPDARTILVTLHDGSVVHGWHLLPAGVVATKSVMISGETERNLYFEQSLRHARCVVLSFHGNAGNRGTRDRVAEDRMLASQAPSENCHVIAIDYRGFGDSTGWPTHWPSEESTAEDALALWQWLEELLRVKQCEEEEMEHEHRNKDHGSSCTAGVNEVKVFIYGHSLGCAVSTQLASHLAGASTGLQPAGLILVSPFTSAADVARDYPYTAFLRLVPYATDVIAHFLHFTYSNTQAITSVECPILVVHGARDSVIPVHHGRRLVESYVSSLGVVCVATQMSREAGDPYGGTQYQCPEPSVAGERSSLVRHVTFVEASSAGHNWVFTSREWLAAVPAFIDKFSQYTPLRALTSE